MPESDPSLYEWSPGKKQIFRFFFIFLLLYLLLNPNNVVPYFHLIQRLYRRPCYDLIVWLTRVVLQIDFPAEKLYSTATDTFFNYLLVFFIVCVSCVGSVIWMFADKRSSNYNRLQGLLFIILRYYLAITWLAYGSLKIIHFQFPELTPIMLMQTYGNSLPRGLAWSFMGYSAGFNYFIGITEYIIGLLLFFRRTSTLGNMIAVGALANIMAFNYFFDDNVKLLSTMLMIATLFLLSKDIRRLLNFFFLGKSATLAEVPSYRFKTKWKNKAVLVFKCVFIVCLLFFDLYHVSLRAKQFGYGLKKPPLYGIYDVKMFVRNKDTLKPLATDTSRWNKLVISAIPGKASIIFMNDSIRYFILNTDTVKKVVFMVAERDTSDKYAFSYLVLKDSSLSLKGKWHNDSLKIQFQPLDLNKLPLVNHKFHWVIEHQSRLKR